MGAEVGDLVLKVLGGGRLLGGRGLEGIDFRAEGGDLGAPRFVGLFKILDAVDKRLVAGDLVGRGQELRLDLARHQEPRRHGDRRHHQDGQDPLALHDAILHVDRWFPRRGFRSSIGNRKWRLKLAPPPSKPPSVALTRRRT
jgi:hypothetical protein